MPVRLLLAVLTVVCAPLAVRSADDDNPYKNAKVGDYASYKMSVKFGAMTFPGTVTQSITAKSDKEITVKTTGMMEIMGNKQEIPAQEHKVDLTKPYDPTNVAGLGALPPGTDLKVEKGKEGKEKVTVGGKDYDSSWTNFTLKGKAAEQGFNADIKMWMTKDMPLGVIKMVMTSEIAKMKMEMTMELTESGNKK